MWLPCLFEWKVARLAVKLEVWKNNGITGPHSDGKVEKKHVQLVILKSFPIDKNKN